MRLEEAQALVQPLREAQTLQGTDRRKQNGCYQMGAEITNIFNRPESGLKWHLLGCRPKRWAAFFSVDSVSDIGTSQNLRKWVLLTGNPLVRQTRLFGDVVWPNLRDEKCIMHFRLVQNGEIMQTTAKLCKKRRNYSKNGEIIQNYPGASGHFSAGLPRPFPGSETSPFCPTAKASEKCPKVDARSSRGRFPALFFLTKPKMATRARQADPKKTQISAEL